MVGPTLISRETHPNISCLSWNLLLHFVPKPQIPPLGAFHPEVWIGSFPSGGRLRTGTGLPTVLPHIARQVTKLRALGPARLVSVVREHG